MKPDWDELGEKYENSKKVIIGDVDCTAEGKPLCERFDVQGYPTLKYFLAGDTSEGESYEGGRSLKELKKFAKSLGPQCGITNIKKCKAKQLEALQPLIDRPREENIAELEEWKAKLKSVKNEHEELQKKLQEMFEESQKKMEAMKTEAEPKIKLLKSAIAPEGWQPSQEGVKDEV